MSTGDRRSPARQLPPQPFGRAAKRHKVFIVAELIDTRGAHRAHLLDLSSTGALVHCEDFARSDRPTSLRLDGRVHPVTIVSNNGARFGVRFTRPFEHSEMEALLAG